CADALPVIDAPCPGGIQLHTRVVGAGGRAEPGRRDPRRVRLGTIPACPEARGTAHFGAQQLIIGWFEVRALRQQAEEVEEQGSGGQRTGEAGPSFAARVAGPYRHAMAAGEADGPSIAVPLAGAGFPGDVLLAG